MGILNWIGLGLEKREEIPPSSPIQGSGVTPPSRGAEFTTNSALGLSSVYRAIMILGTAASQLTLDAWRGEDPLEPKPAFIRKPDVDTSLSAFLEASVVSLAVSGDAYWKLTRNARNEVTNAVVLDPWQCVEDPEKKTLTWAGRKTPLSSKEFTHLRLMRVPGSTNGLGPIQAARSELLGIRDLRDYSSGWFASGDTPSGLLKTDQSLNADQADEYKSRWQERDAHEVAVLGNGLDYTPILLSPHDAQFIESQQFSVTQVARLFGIPANLMLAVVEGGSMTYSNVAQADLTFVRWTLMKYLREIEEAFTEILPGIQSARFNLDALLRPDTKTRYEAHKVALDAGFLTINEVRKLEGLPDIVIPKSEPLPAPTEETP